MYNYTNKNKGYKMTYEKLIEGLAKDIEGQLRQVSFKETGMIVVTALMIDTLIDQEYEREFAEELTSKMAIDINPSVEMTDSIRKSLQSIVDSYVFVFKEMDKALLKKGVENRKLFLIEYAKKLSINIG